MRLFQNIDGIVEIYVAIIIASNDTRVYLNGAGPRQWDIYDRVEPKLTGRVLKQVVDRLGVIRREGEGFPSLLPRGDNFPMVFALFQIQIHRLRIVRIDDSTYLARSCGRPRRCRFSSNRRCYGRGDGVHDGRGEGV